MLFFCCFKAERASYVSNVWKAEKQLVRMWKLWGFPWPGVKNFSGMYTVELRDIVQQLTWQEVHRHNLERGGRGVICVGVGAWVIRSWILRPRWEVASDWIPRSASSSWPCLCSSSGALRKLWGLEERAGLKRCELILKSPSSTQRGTGDWLNVYLYLIFKRKCIAITKINVTSLKVFLNLLFPPVSHLCTVYIYVFYFFYHNCCW